MRIRAESDETRSASNVPTAKEAAARMAEFGDYVIHYNAITTDQIPQEAARNYGISRSKSKVLLNVVINKKVAGSTLATSGKVLAKVNNLTGQLKNMSMQEKKSGDAIYYIGETSISDGEFLTFKIQAQPEGERQLFDVTFQQQFYTK